MLLYRDYWITYKWHYSLPLETELAYINNHIGWAPDFARQWIAQVYNTLHHVNKVYPFLSYGTDWLAFAHIMLAVLFIGPLRYPVKNVWVIQFGIIACIAIVPLSFIAGPTRHVPFFWRLIDCSFGFFGIIPLIIAYKYTKKLAAALGNPAYSLPQ